MADSRQQRRIVDLVAVQVQDGQYRAVADGVEEFVDMPRGRQRASFGFAVADHGSNDQVRVVKCGPAGVGQHITQFAALMDGTRRFRGAMATDAAGEGELLEKCQQTFFIQAFFRVDFGIRAFQIDRTQHSRCAVTGAGHENGIQVVFFDGTVHVGVGKRQRRTGPPMAQQTVLDMFGF